MARIIRRKTCLDPARSAIQRYLLGAAVIAAALCGSSSARAQCASPTVTLGVPGSGFIGESFSVSLTFDNTGPATGFGPYAILFLPAGGIDGDDGITFAGGGNFLGFPTVQAVITIPPGGSFVNPLTGSSVSGTPGDQAVILQLPFGSFTPGQPAATISIDVDLSDEADLGAALTIRAFGGFSLGCDALDNPGSDPAIAGATVTAEFSPTLATIRKTFSGPENETATGPNFPRTYTVFVDIADGQTVTNLVLADLLPPQAQYIEPQTPSLSPGGCTVTEEPVSGAAQNAPDNDLVISCASLVAAAGDDLTVSFSFFVPELDADGAPVLNPDEGGCVAVTNNAGVQFDWDPIDVDDPVANDYSPDDAMQTFSACALAIQKDVSLLVDPTGDGVSPGDTLGYTYDFQVSDYFVLGGPGMAKTQFIDTFSDGQRLDANAFGTAMPVDFSFTDRVGTSTAPFTTGANLDVDESLKPDGVIDTGGVCGDGSTTLTLDVSQQLVDIATSHGSATMIGGCIMDPPAACPPGQMTAAIGAMTYRTIVQDQFSCAPPSGDLSVDQGDAVDNQVDGTADVRTDLGSCSTAATTCVTDADCPMGETCDRTDTGNTSGQGSTASIGIDRGTLSKAVYARNGDCADTGPTFAAGDTITYLLRLTVPTSDFEDLTLTDFLPLPVLFAADFDADGTLNGTAPTFGWTFDNSDNTAAGACAAGTPPPLGVARYGADDDFHDLASAPDPAIAADDTDNSLVFDYGTFDDPLNTPTVIQVLFTVRLSSQPFADQLFLTNQVQARDRNSFLMASTQDAINMIELTQPILNLRKGVVETDNPAGMLSGTPLPAGVTVDSADPSCSSPRLAGTVHSTNLPATMQSTLTGVDAGDRVTFAVVVENTGAGIRGAFDVQLRDTRPPGFSIPGSGLNLCVQDGAGGTIAYSVLGMGFFDPAGGIQLSDPGPVNPQPGVLEPFDALNGRNIAIITYDLILDGPADMAPVGPGDVLTNTATLFNYAGTAGGPDHTVDANPLCLQGIPAPCAELDLVAMTSVTVADVETAKDVSAIAPGPADSGALTDVTVGDVVTFSFTVTFPESLSTIELVDTLPAGFAYVVGSAALDLSGFGANTITNCASGCTVPTSVTAGAGSVTIDLGQTSVTDSSNATLVVTLQATVIDDPSNVGASAPGAKTNTLTVRADGMDVGTDAAGLSFEEPRLQVLKSIGPALLDGGDTATITITVRNTGLSPAFDMVFEDPLLAMMDSNGPIFVAATIAEDATAAGFSYGIGLCTGAATVVCEVTADCPGVETCTVDNVVRYQSAPGISIAPAGAATFSFTAALRADVTTSTTYVNTATATGDGQDGVPPSGVQRDAVDDGSANLPVPRAGVRKDLVATSENSTDPGEAKVNANPPVAIGEIVTAEIVFTMPEGVTKDVRLIDVLPGGLEFLPGTATLRRNSASLTVDAGGDNSALNSAPIDTPVAAVQLAPATAVTGEIVFSLGDVDNSAMSNGTPENFTLRLSAVVRNNSANNSGTGLTDRGRIRFADGNGAQMLINSNNRTVHVAEPVPAIDKVATPAAPMGGPVTFTVIVSNTSSGSNAATGFEWNVTDTLPVGYENPMLVAVDAMGSGAVVAPCGFTLNALSCEIDELEPGEAVKITYTADIGSAAVFGQTITNTATAGTTSLPGGGGTGICTGSGITCTVDGDCGGGTDLCRFTPGGSGATTGERDASGGANDLRVSDPAMIVVDTPSIEKTTIDPRSYYAIGDMPTFQVTVAIPQGSTDALSVEDTLPPGLTYKAGTAMAVLPTDITGLGGMPGPFAESTPGFFSQAGPVLTFDFGDVVAAGAGDILITYQVTVDNVLSNQDGVTRVNRAELFFADPANPSGPPRTDGPFANTAPVRVGEPNLQLTKVITAGATGSQAGDTISYRIAIANNGHITAFRSDWSDVLPGTAAMNDGLEQISNAMLAVSGGSAVLNSDGVTALGSGDLVVSMTNNPDDTLGLPLFDLAPGATLTITFDAVLGANVSQGQVLDNVTDISYDSQPAGSDGRDNSDDGDDDDDTDLDNYGEAASQSLTVLTDIAIDKTVSPTTYTVGEEVTYTVRVDFIEGVTENLRVTDILPVGLLYLSHSVAVGNMGIGFSNAGFDTNLGAGQVVALLFGDVSNPPNADDTDDFLTIEIVARVRNVVANQTAAVLTNGGAPGSGSELFLEFGPDPMAPTRQDFDSDGTTPGTQGLDIVLVEPDLEIVKTAVPTSVALGDVVTFIVTVSHTANSSSDAFDLALSDVLPAGLTYVSGSATLPPADVTALGQNLDFEIASLPLASGSVMFMYQATVDGDAAVGVAATNGIDLTWAGLADADGAVDGGRNGADGEGGALNDYADSSSADVTPTIDAFIDATKTVALAIDADMDGSLTPGDTLEYSISLVNMSGALSSVVFTDTMPAQTTYVPSSTFLDGVMQTEADDVADATDFGVTTLNTLTIDIGNMAAAGDPGGGDSIAITFRVTVDAGTAVGTVLSNQGVVDSNQTVPEPTDENGEDADGDQPTDIPVGNLPPPTNTLYVEKLYNFIEDVDANGYLSPGDRVEYLFIFNNFGNSALTGVTLADTIPAGLTFEVGSEMVSNGGSIVVAAPAVAVSGLTVAAMDFEFASFVVTIDDPFSVDNDANAEMETFVNQGVADSKQTGPVNTDGNSDPSDGNQPTEYTAVDNPILAVPLLDLEKRWNLFTDLSGNGIVNPGDTLRYTLTMRNVGAAAALDVFLNDTIPAGSMVVPGSVISSQGLVLNDDPVLINIGIVDPGDVVTVTFLVVVDPSIVADQVIANQATTTVEGQPGPNSDDNGDDGDGSNPTLTPVDVDDGQPPASYPRDLLKMVFATSEADSLGGQVFIGEVVTFDVTVTVPQGRLAEAMISDALPDGLSYIAGSARLISDFDVAFSASENPGNVNTAASGNEVALADGSEVGIAGGVVTVFLGDIINSDNDPDAETITLRIDAVVENIADNNAGTSLVNQGVLTFRDALNRPQTLPTVEETLSVIEPALMIDKLANPAGLLPSGGTITFTITIVNPAGPNVGTAYDVEILDMLPPEYTSMVLISAVPSGGVSGVDTSATGGTTLSVAVGEFPPDGELVITLEATAMGPLTESVVMNTSSVTWTTLPGDRGSNDDTPGDPGDGDGERTGDINSGAVNDNQDEDDAVVVVGTPGFAKEIVMEKPRYAIGDIVSYRVLITIPQGPFPFDDALFEDVLDAGLMADTTSVVITLPAGVTSTSQTVARFDDTPVVGQETLEIDFGDISNANMTPQTIVIEYQALVENILANQEGVILENVASVAFMNPIGGTETFTDMEDVIVGEPHLGLQKSVVGPATGLQAGDPVTFAVTLINDGTTTAFDTVLSDVLPMDQLVDIGAIAVTSVSGGAPTPAIVVGPNAPDGGPAGDSWTTDPFDLPVGGMLTIQFTVVLDVDIQANDMIQNVVDATFGSRPLTDPNRRDGASPGSDQDDDGDLDNYNTTTPSLPVIVPFDPVAVAKRFYPNPTDHQYTIGELLTYRVTISLLEGTVNGLVLTDDLPPGVVFVPPAVVLPGNANIVTDYAGVAMQSGQTLTLDFGTVVNPPNPNAGDDFIDVDVTVRVDDVIGNQNGTILTNQAGIEFRDAGNNPIVRAAPPVDAEVVLPVLEIEKSADPTSVALGGEVEFTLVVRHTPASGADAFDVTVPDALPVGLTYVAGSGTPMPMVSGQMLTFPVGNLTKAAAQFVITFRARVDGDAEVDLALVNTALANYSTLPGDDPNERQDLETFPDDADVTPNDSESIEATKTVVLLADADSSGSVTPGDVLEYTIDLENRGDRVTNVVFTDPIPLHTTYVSGSLMSAPAGAPDDSGDPLVVLVPAMLAGDVVTISFQVTVDVGTPPGTVLSNQGVVDSDQTIPEQTDNDGSDGDGDEPTDLISGVPLAPALSLGKAVELTGDADTNGVINDGDTITYTVTIANTGLANLTNVVFSDMVPIGPPGISPVTMVTTSQGVAPAPSNNVVINVGTIVPGGIVAITIAGVVNGAGTVTNTATATAAGGLQDGDSVTFSAEPTGVNMGTPDLGMTKAVAIVVDNNGDGALNPFETLRYTIKLTNTGSAPATNVFFTDTLPSNLTLESLSTGGILLSPNPVLLGQPGPVIVANFGTIDVGETVSVTAEMSVPLAVPHLTLVSNQAIVTSNELPPLPSDDPDTPGGDDPTDIIVIALPDLEISKEHSRDFRQGKEGIYVIRVRNLGPGPTTGPIVVTDLLPPELTFVSAGGSGWTCSATGKIVTCVSNAILLPGQEQRITLRARVDFLGRTVAINVASVETEGDDDLTNNRAEDPTVIIAISPAPALSPGGMLVALGLLLTVSALAMRRRRRTALVSSSSSPLRR